MAFSAGAARRDAAGLRDPVLPEEGEGRGWGVRRAVRIAFPEPADRVCDAAYAARLDLYMQDMLRAHGLDPSPDARDRTGWSYSEMATALIERAVPAQESVDLLVLAYAIPDINPGRNMAALLSERCPGKPLAFGLTDQGVAAPFTALRLIREYARTTGLRRALLLVVEQAALPYRASDRTAMPAGHTGVALLIGEVPHEPNAAPSLRLGQIVTRVEVREDALDHEIKTLCAEHSESTVILGSALSNRLGQAGGMASAGAGRVRVARAGRPLTGLWWELVGELDARDGSPRSVTLCDYDPVQGCFCVAVLGTHSASGHSHARATTRNGSAPTSAIAAR